MHVCVCEILCVCVSHLLYDEEPQVHGRHHGGDEGDEHERLCGAKEGRSVCVRVCVVCVCVVCVCVVCVLCQVCVVCVYVWCVCVSQVVSRVTECRGMSTTTKQRGRRVK